jgi:hypothetical protein
MNEKKSGKNTDISEVSMVRQLKKELGCKRTCECSNQLLILKSPIRTTELSI